MPVKAFPRSVRRIAACLMFFTIGMAAACHSSGAKTVSRSMPSTARKAAPADLPGITPASGLLSDSAPLTSVDVLFYLRVMQAAVARYQQPTARDNEAMVQEPLIAQREAQAVKQMAADMKAGKYQQASADVHHPTTGEKDLKDRYAALTTEGADVLIAQREDMPERQWSALKTAVEMAAHAGGFSVASGSAGDGGSAVLTQAQIQRAKQQQAVMDENEKFIAPFAVQIRLLASKEMKEMQDLRMKGGR